MTFTDTNGVEHTIAGFAGKTVVLEWTNPECPFDKKHYETGNMQKLQKEATDMGAIWVAVNSGGEGKQGSYATDEAANADNKAKGFAGTAYVRDVAGEFGKTFGAKTTPHMYVINPEGVLAYAGAIDSIPSAQFEDVEKAENYVMAAVKAIAAGEEVSPSSTQPYGCSVKYAN
ncbi:MAG: thioredoxin family protein [Acidobacteriota bacterium]